MQGKQLFLENLLETVEDMLSQIEEREVLEPDLALIRELAEQLREEVESIQ